MKLSKTIMALGGALLLSVPMHALTIGRTIELSGIESGAWHPQLNADGTRVLFSTQNHQGLNNLDLVSGEVTVLDTDAGAGFTPAFSADGKSVIYRTAGMVDGLTCRDVRQYSFADGKKSTRRSMNREDVNLKAEAGIANYAVENYRNIVVCIDGKTTTINPLSDAHSYLWASLSPDGTRIMFSEPFMGLYICNIDGTGARRIAQKADFPAWAGNDIVVYAVSHDDGYQILDATLKALDLTTGECKDVSAPDMKVSEVTASPDGKVVYSSLEGKLFLVTVNN